jgi:hypothetical protein
MTNLSNPKKDICSGKYPNICKCKIKNSACPVDTNRFKLHLSFFSQLERGRPFRTKFELSTRASDDLLDTSKMRQKTHLETVNFPQISAGNDVYTL